MSAGVVSAVARLDVCRDWSEHIAFTSVNLAKESRAVKAVTGGGALTVVTQDEDGTTTSRTLTLTEGDFEPVGIVSITSLGSGDLTLLRVYY